MRVKRLEVQGFKSFKDKTVIHFDHSITGIVGPNGCGKSNIVDAFFWVMGEQSYKHIRGSGSGDMIFNGSSQYSPLGMAEATLVFESTEVDTKSYPAGASTSEEPLKMKPREISVTRRVYRDGEGEYFINGVPARLKDIKELFMDTGVGAKGYSVIEQGQIGKIVNSKPEDRRVLIEEAAGIAKYKARKIESLRKMEAAEANLSRLNDVVKEIERNLESLDRQAQKARKYREYKQELLEKEIPWGRRKAQVLQAKSAEFTQTKTALDQELLGLRTEVQTTENNIEADRAQQLTDSKLAEDLQTKIQNLARELTQEQSTLELSRRRQEDLTQQLGSMENEKVELAASLEREQSKLLDTKKELEEAESALTTAAREAFEAEQKVTDSRQQSDTERRNLDALRKELIESMSNTSEMASRTASLQARMESAQAQLAPLQQEETAAQEKIAALQSGRQTTDASLESLKADLESLSHKKSTLTQSVQDLEAQIKSAEKAREQSVNNTALLASRLESLKELAASYEGISDGAKSILDWARGAGKDGSFGVLGDLFEVAAGYDDALEGWLEGRLESLFARDTHEAVSALETLRTGKSGRASIYVESTQALSPATAGIVSFAALRDGLESINVEVLGPLDQFVTLTATQGLSPQLQTWLQGVCVVDRITEQTLKPWMGWSLVALDGTVLDSEGFLRGGSTERDVAANILRRKRAIQELSAQVEEANQARLQAEQSVTTLKEQIEQARSETQEIQTRAQALEIEIRSAQKDIEQNQNSIRDAQAQLTRAIESLATLTAEIARAESECAEITAQFDGLNSRKQEIETQVAAADAELASKDQNVRALEAELHTMRVYEASLRERAVGIKRDLLSMQALIDDRQKRLTDIDVIARRVQEEKSNHQGGDSGLFEKIETLTRQLSTEQAQLSQIKDKLETSSALFGQNMERIKALHQNIDAKSGKINEIALEIEKISVELNHLKLALEEKYGADCLENTQAAAIQENMPDPVVTQEMTEEEERVLGEEVERLKERIRRLGEVNTMAIDEYEEIKKRYDYLTGERTDLETSIQNLKDAIDHINKTSEDRFRKAFEAIASRFQKLFPIIFGGGQAELSLVYPEGSTDILEAGIDILAQPPGKKISNITLLSGGEKALTAIALIFAIFMVKPSPFCLLDEVDAPLDDSNIGKFNALLKEMATKTQFILITHNKKTMELNDTLYGVTMEEPGVSKMVSIEMR